MKLPPIWPIVGIGLPSGVAGAAAGYVLATYGYPVDWDATGAMLQGNAAILAACTAAWGVNQWRKELRFKRNSELALQVMVAVEGLARNMVSARRAPEEFEIDHAKGNGRVLQRFAYDYRLSGLKSGEYAAELEGLLNQIAAIFGSKHRVAVAGLTAVYFTLLFSLEQSIHLRDAIDQGNGDGNELEMIAKLSDTLFPRLALPPQDAVDGFGIGLAYAAEKVRSLFRTSL